MEIINNRYRILETEYSNRVFSCHVAKDILYPNEESFRIFIVKPQMMPSLAMQKFISDFQVYSSIKHPYIVKGEHVDMIFSIDRNPVERSNYYFVVEKFDYNTSFLDYSYAQTDSDILLDKNTKLTVQLHLLSEQLHLIKRSHYSHQDFFHRHRSFRKMLILCIPTLL